MYKTFIFANALALLFIFLLAAAVFPQKKSEQEKLDERVEAFLDAHRYQWRDLNVPTTDGRILYDLIIKNNYTRALEIGTSTGHSAVWIAWALSKTGGKLITIEIDEERYEEALKNFSEAGLTKYIDARLADAHKLVPELKGPFDFVFCDADKDWYTNYFKAAAPKLTVDGCFAAHNVTGGRGRYRRSGTGGFYDYVRSLENFETSLIRESRSGMSVSYEKSEK